MILCHSTVDGVRTDARAELLPGSVALLERSYVQTIGRKTGEVLQRLKKFEMLQARSR